MVYMRSHLDGKAFCIRKQLHVMTCWMHFECYFNTGVDV